MDVTLGSRPSWAGTDLAATGSHAGSRRAAPQRGSHRQLRDHRVRSGAHHGAPLQSRIRAGRTLGLPGNQAAAGAGELLSWNKAAWRLTDVGCSSGLPDERTGRTPPVYERVRRRAGRRCTRHHDVHDRPAPEGDRADRGPRLCRDDRLRRYDLKVLQLAGRAPREWTGRPSCRRSRTSLLSSLLALPPGKWGNILGSAAASAKVTCWKPGSAMRRTRSSSPGAASTAPSGRAPGDYSYPVDANVAPATKLNLLTTRTLRLDVQIDDVGNARNSLAVTWDNRVEAPEWSPYRAMVNTGGRILGTYFRLLLPGAKPRRGGLRWDPLAAR